MYPNSNLVVSPLEEETMIDAFVYKLLTPGKAPYTI